MYDAKNPSATRRTWRFWSKQKQQADSDTHVIPPDTAISIRNLGKDFHGKLFGNKKGIVTAIADLTLDIPKFGIFVLLGANGCVLLNLVVCFEMHATN